jgi:hypothetical protein
MKKPFSSIFLTALGAGHVLLRNSEKYIIALAKGELFHLTYFSFYFTSK